jgi:hypothetical protein
MFPTGACDCSMCLQSSIDQIAAAARTFGELSFVRHSRRQIPRERHAIERQLSRTRHPAILTRSALLTRPDRVAVILITPGPCNVAPVDVHETDDAVWLTNMPVIVPIKNSALISLLLHLSENYSEALSLRMICERLIIS